MGQARETVLTIPERFAETRDTRSRALRMAPASASGSSTRTFMSLLQREIVSLREKFRFHATLVLILSLMIVSALINAVRYQAELESYRATQADYLKELEGTGVADLAGIRHPAIKPPWKLAFVVDGGQSSSPNVYRQALSPWHKPELESRHSASARLNPSEPLDWLFLIRVIISLAAFVLAYDAFCGERQRAVLRMVLSYPVARWQVVAAKLVAIWLGLVGPFVVGIPLCLLILHLYGDLSFTLADGLKILEVSILGLWASAVFVLIALLVSAFCRESARSLASLALIWITAVVVIPASGSLMARLMAPLPSAAETDEQMAAIKAEVEREGAGTWRQFEVAKAHDFDLEQEATDIQNRRYERQEELRRKLVDDQFRQLQLAQWISSISPMSLIQDLAERIVGSGSYRDRTFQRQAWAFRADLQSYVKALDAADPDSPNLLFIHDFMSDKPIEPDEVPRFEFRELPVGQGLWSAFWHLLALTLATLALTAAALAAFAREDVG